MDQKQQEPRPLEPKKVVSRGDWIAFFGFRSCIFIDDGAFMLSEMTAGSANLLDTSPYFHC